MPLFSVDCGYGDTKVAGENGHRASFPSVIARAKGSGELAAVFGASPPQHRVEIEPVKASPDLAGAWFAGKAALAVGGTRAWDTAASARTGYDVLTLAALGLCGAEGPVELAAGLPLAVWLDKKERRALRERLLGLSAWVGVNGKDARYIDIAHVRVLPQALGAYLAALNSPGGVRLAGRAVGVIDVGYRTTDYLLLTPDDVTGLAVPDEARSGSVDAGVGRAYAEVAAEIARETAGMAPESLIERTLMSDGILTVRGQDRDLKPLFNQACAALAAEVEAHIRRAWSDRIDFLAAIVLAGGGGIALAPHLTLPAVEPAPDAAFANTLGFLMLAGRAEVQRAV